MHVLGLYCHSGTETQDRRRWDPQLEALQLQTQVLENTVTQSGAGLGAQPAVVLHRMTRSPFGIFLRPQFRHASGLEQSGPSVQVPSGHMDVGD